MTAYTSIGKAEAQALLGECKALGSVIAFSHRGATAVDLYAVTIRSGLQVINTRMGLLERNQTVLLIPVQTGLAVISTAVKPIVKGDRIEYPKSSGRYFEVADTIPHDGNEYIFQVTLTETKSLTHGNSNT